MKQPWSVVAVACAQLALGVLLLAAVWGLLPARWLPIDLTFSAIALLQVAAAVALLAGKPFARKLALAAGWTTLLFGAALVTALSFTVAHLSGLYGPVGQGGALLMVVIAALVLPYLVLLPALQLALLRARG
jgi:hypothetical protein